MEETKLIINEPDYYLSVAKWTPLTKQFLNMINEEKCNTKNNNSTKNDKPLENSNELEIEEHELKRRESELVIAKEKLKLKVADNENFEKYLDKDEPINKHNTPRNKDGKWANKESDEDILGRYGKNQYPVYKSIFEYVWKNLKDTFRNKDLNKIVYNAYREIKDNPIAKGTAAAYSFGYRKHMFEEGLIYSDDEFNFYKIKKTKSLLEEKEDNKEDLFFKYGIKLEQSNRGSPLQRYIFRWAINKNSEIVTPLEIYENPITGCFDNVTEERLHDALISLSVNGLVEEIETEIFKINFDRL